ncbi:MAG TPA: diacylglycerol kinase, partial [Actinomycetota bacterium]|nr:diacylglycerol kinase [Actinomycetota bacterium]
WLEAPVRCTLRPVTLRVRVPCDRPGVPHPKPTTDWERRRHLALTMHGQG